MKVLSWTNYCLTPVFLASYSYSRSQSTEPKAACSRWGNTHNRLAVYYRAHTDKHTTHSDSTRQFKAYIFSDCEKKLRLNPDKYTSCKLQRPRFKPTLCVRQQCKPLKHCIALVNKLHTNTATTLSSLCKEHFQEGTFFWVVNSLWLCLRPNHRLCASVYAVDIQDSL